LKILRWRADRKPTLDEVETMFKDEGLEYTVESMPPETAMKEHKHPFDEVRMVVKGTIRYNVSGNEFILKEGDRLELPSNTRHWTKSDASSECVSVYAFKVH
jgi:quercetin dioxygenase-like cupin family protein